MANINFSYFWKSFVSDFIEVQEGKIIVTDEVNDYHPIVQRCFCKLGWTSEQDLFHHFSLGRKNERPDFFIKYDHSLKHNQGIPIEVKMPNNVMDEENKEQLIEYMRLSDSNIGIYIGEHIRIFYRPSLEEDLKIVIDASFANEDIAGIVFTELFFSAAFNIESLKTTLNKYYELERLIDDKNLTDFDNSTIPEGWLVDRYEKRAFLSQTKSSVGKKNKVRIIKQTNTISGSATNTPFIGSMKNEYPCQILLCVPQSIKDILEDGVRQMKRQKLPKENCTIKYTSRIWLLKGLLQDGLITEAQYQEASELPSQYGWNKRNSKK